ncbi:siderophore-interacting protein [Rhodococcus sp. ARC_M6]|uniref:siderophore-interacting protein n=1 Tax=Rhodococcus sp. ARC_M6 TaxID=2928852 RepID=UPI001FB49997|nr:siderophore-interacting protein [Rhodococcus sp. ARC_M6]MCJ0903882.1 siderophore-interacting protein [Rhodococcus sp. ARC_M6]
MAKRSKFVKPATRSVATAEVVANKRISPTFIRITIAGEELSTIAPMGADQWFRIFIPQAGNGELRLPSAASALWYAQYLRIPKDVRPVLRAYTVRAYREAGSGLFGETPEIDIDFAFHGDIGPASAWAVSAASGDKVGLLDEGLIYNPAPEATWQLLVGDESALPAILGILDSAPTDLRAEVFIEIPHPDDKQEHPELGGVNVHWLVREDPQAKPGVLALETVRAADLPTGPSYTFVGGEQALTTGLRRHLVNDRNFAKQDISFTGFWRVGHAAN